MVKKIIQKSIDRRRGEKFYTRELTDMICQRLADGESLREICREDNMPSESAVRGWVVQDVDGLHARYARAREAQMDRWAEEIIEIGDDATNDWMTRRDGSKSVDQEVVNRARLRIDARKWLMSKLAPKTYGEKVEIAHVNQPAEMSDHELTDIAHLATGSGDGAVTSKKGSSQLN